MKEVEIIPTEVLLKELQNRFDHLIVSGRRKALKNEGGSITVERWKGDYSICIGLCSQMSYGINIIRLNNSKQADINNE